MNDTTRKSRLDASLKIALGLNNLSKSSDFVNYLLPYLQELSRVQYVDPTKYKERSEYEFALDRANLRAGVFAELLSFIAQQEAVMNKIRKDLEKPPQSYGI